MQYCLFLFDKLWWQLLNYSFLAGLNLTIEIASSLIHYYIHDYSCILCFTVIVFTFNKLFCYYSSLCVCIHWILLAVITFSFHLLICCILVADIAFSTSRSSMDTRGGYCLFLLCLYSLNAQNCHCVFISCLHLINSQWCCFILSLLILFAFNELFWWLLLFHFLFAFDGLFLWLLFFHFLFAFNELFW